MRLTRPHCLCESGIVDFHVVKEENVVKELMERSAKAVRIIS